MDATTAASAIGDNIQLLNQTCTGLGNIVSIGLRETGKVSCFNGTSTFPYNWIDPLSDAPGDPSYQVRRINLLGSTPIFGPLDGVWTKVGLFADIISLIATAGSGYSVNDKLTPTGGTFSRAAVYNVDSVGGGGNVTAVSIFDEGSYSQVTVPPLSNSPTTVAPPGGSGATITVSIGFHFNWVLIAGIGPPLSCSFDVQLRKETGPTLRTARWGMTTLGGIIP